MSAANISSSSSKQHGSATMEDKLDAAMEFLTMACNKNSTTSNCENNSLRVDQLSDGVLLFDLLNQVSPKHFVKDTIARKLGENWALKLTNLHKIMNNINIFFQEVLYKTAQNLLQSVDITAIARCSDSSHILKMFSIIAVATVQCENRGFFVSLILKMSPSGQERMKEILEDALLNIYHLDTTVKSTPGVAVNQSASSFLMDDCESSSSLFDLYDVHSTASKHRFFSNDKNAVANYNSTPFPSPKMKRDLSNEFLRAEMKEMESSNRALVEEVSALNEQVHEKKREAASMVVDLRELRRTVQRKEEEVQYLRDRNCTLEDDISIAQAQGQKLRKAEATITAYRDKLENMHDGSQLEKIEAKSSSLVKQIVEMKADVANIPSMQRTIVDYKNRNLNLKKDLEVTISSVREKENQIAALEGRLSFSECAKALAENELAASREMDEIRDMEMKRATASATSITNVTDVNSSPSAMVELRSLRQTNNKLRDRIAALESKLCSQEIQSKMKGIAGGVSDETVALESMQIGAKTAGLTYSLLRSVVNTVNRLVAIFAVPFILVGFVVLSNLLVTSCPAPF